MKIDSLCGQKKNFRGSTIESTPFHYKKFHLSKIEIQYGKGVPIAATSIGTTKNTRFFYNAICALGFTRGGNGIEMADYEANHYFFVFDLTSSRDTGKALTLIPELIGASFSLKLSIAEALSHPVELFLVRERFSQIFIDGTRNISTNSLING